MSPKKTTKKSKNSVIKSNFSIHTGGYIQTKDVLAIELPKLTIKPVGLGDDYNLEEISPLLIVLTENKDTCSRLLEAAKKGFAEFKIKIPAADCDEEDVWSFGTTFVEAIDFGALEIDGEDGPPERTIKCEVRFKDLTINDIKLN